MLKLDCYFDENSIETKGRLFILAVAALVLVVATGLGTPVRRVETNSKLLVEQNRYLRYLAQRSRAGRISLPV